MKRARVNEVELEYEETGAGEPVLLIHGAHIAEAMVPLVTAPPLDGFELIRYHRRGYAGSSRHTRLAPPDVLADDAAALVDVLGHHDTHVVGHSSGGVIAIELAIRHPGRVRSLALLEPPVLTTPSGEVFRELVEPLASRFADGDASGAVEGFLALVGGADWRDALERNVPGALEQATRDAATFFEHELPAVGTWTCDAARAAVVTCPVLTVLGSASGPLFAEARPVFHEWFVDCADADLPGVGHFMQMEAPNEVADALATFLRRARSSSNLPVAR